MLTTTYQTLRPHRSPRARGAVTVALAFLVVAGACSPRGDVGAATPAHGSSASTPVDTVAHPSSAARSDSAVAKGEVNQPATALPGVAAAKAPASGPRGDSSIASGLDPERTAHDRTSFIDAIRLGRQKMATWPKDTVLPGAVFPGHRVVAFYGNPLAKKMGVLGEYPEDVMFAKLDTEVARWREADPTTPVQPALHLIAVVAQGAPGRDGMYRLRMDTALIEKVYGWAQQRHALLFLDVQVGKSTLQAELPRLLPFLARPDVHLGIDPEFSMHYDQEGNPPGKKIGEMDAADVNYAIATLAKVAADNHLPPKILIVHRFTTKMVLNVMQIHPVPNVQVVMDMDGLGPPWLKFDSYRDYIVANPIEFTGFKLFYHVDPRSGKEPMLTPAEVMHLLPHPLYIQYQ